MGKVLRKTGEHKKYLWGVKKYLKEVGLKNAEGE